MSIALVDFSALFHRIWHINRDETEHRCLEFMASLTQYDEVIACLDSPPYKRKDVDPNYKANRDVPDPELVGSLRTAIEKVASRGIAIARCDGWEGDDVIASLVVHTTEEAISVYGTDKDLLQITDLIEPFTNDVKTAHNTLGVPREKVLDYLCLVGDSSDNIKGVAGVGPKTAVKMLDKFGTLGGILDAVKNSPSSFTEKTSTAIMDAMEWLDTTRELITLNTELDVQIEKREREETTMEESETVEAESVEVEPTEKPGEPRHIVKMEPIAYRHGLEPVGMGQAWRTSKMMYDSCLYPKFKSPEQIMMVVMRGRALGIDSTTALDVIHMIQGKPTMAAQGLVGLVKSSPVCEYFVCKEMSDTACTWETKRRGDPVPSSRTFTIDEAQRLGLTGKDNWNKQPNVMLQWRAAASLCRQVYPDIILGVYATEEME